MRVERERHGERRERHRERHGEREMKEIGKQETWRDRVTYNLTVALPGLKEKERRGWVRTRVEQRAARPGPSPHE